MSCIEEESRYSEAGRGKGETIAGIGKGKTGLGASSGGRGGIKIQKGCVWLAGFI
jgi:hypothetical protein